ncbi:GAF and ANTAR domain-containing protein [Nesterenkonia xinjiangensis]|uniref:GAF domain-containing protein n=1 Tax=Nesterenkonia xinjiangensis TaxID=225327 RepID=A0A7Z0GJG9_9MICC|nr:GAF and ANTAR domain-containing protein [Nesterenkonia xinjiangensis]NYJ77067.1 GAF domain-containing protein [Nesterenkonia xinjiangensis]
MSHDDPEAAGQQLYELLAKDRELTEFLHEVAGTSAGQIGRHGRTGCGVILTRGRRNTVVGYSDPDARRMDEIQAGFDDGPCLTAQRTETISHVVDVLHETRWPAYMSEVRAFGIRSILGVPLVLGDAGAAAMNFYSTEPDSFTTADIEDARRFSRIASQALTVAARIARAQEAAEHRRRAMESRTPIDVAVGIVMAQNRCSQEAAFEILQTASSHRNVKLRDLATELVASIGQPVPVAAFEE